MWKPLSSAALLACVVLAPAQAGTFAELPLSAPLPSPRPAAIVPAPQPIGLEARADISTVPEPIPEARLHVRTVGPHFLPPPSELIDFANRPSSDPWVFQVVEDMVSATVRHSWQGAAPIEDGTTTVASSQ